MLFFESVKNSNVEIAVSNKTPSARGSLHEKIDGFLKVPLLREITSHEEITV